MSIPGPGSRATRALSTRNQLFDIVRGWTRTLEEETYHADIVSVQQKLRKLDLSTGVVAESMLVSEKQGLGNGWASRMQYERRGCGCHDVCLLAPPDCQVNEAKSHSQFGHVLQDHVYSSSQYIGTYRWRHKEGVLTDVVVEPKQGSRELWSTSAHRIFSIDRFQDSPLSPFMTTQILEPTHLSISSIEG